MHILNGRTESLSNNWKLYKKSGYVFHDFNNNKSIEYFNKAIQLNPNCWQAYIGKGYALHDLNQNFAALECYNEAINLNPKDVLCHCYRASLLNDIWQEEKSYEDFNKAYNFQAENFNAKTHIKISNEDILEFIKTLCNFQKKAVELKMELERIKERGQTKRGFLKSLKEKEAEIKQRHSNILKKAIRCIDKRNNKNVGDLEHIEDEITDHQKAMSNTIAQLWWLLSSNNHQIIRKTNFTDKII